MTPNISIPFYAIKFIELKFTNLNNPKRILDELDGFNINYDASPFKQGETFTVLLSKLGSNFTDEEKALEFSTFLFMIPSSFEIFREERSCEEIDEEVMENN